MATIALKWNNLTLKQTEDFCSRALKYIYKKLLKTKETELMGDAGLWTGVRRPREIMNYPKWDDF
jgi:hypothetical protein